MTPRAFLRLSSIALAGGLGVLAFAPFGFAPLLILSLAWLYGQLVGRSAGRGFLLGWVFGLGFLGVGVSWIRISLDEFGNLPGWLAWVLMGLFILGMALYYGLLGAGTAWLSQRRPVAGALLVFPGLWVLLEWMRGWFLTGFPWLNAGTTQVQGPLAGFAPLLGVYGVSLLVVLSGGLVWVFVRGRRAWRILALSLFAALWSGGWALTRLDWTQPDGPPLSVAVIQGNIPPAIKWKPEARAAILRTYVVLTRENRGRDLIVWPETAVPDFLHRVQKPLLEPLVRETPGTRLVLGIPFLDRARGRYYNGALSLGSVSDRYAKRHLVPFGEFTPFNAWLGPLAEALAVPMSDFSAGTAPRPLLRVGDHSVGISICYEDAFPAELIPALPEARYLINLTNDAWFGDSLAPHQHLAIARMRALETGRWLLRAANTGISAVIDSRGRIVRQLPLFQRGSLRAAIQPRRGSTPFASRGNGPAIGLALGLLLLGVLVHFSSRRMGFVIE